MEAKIYSVESACYCIAETMPAQLSIQASGTVNSTDWTNGTLIPWTYVTQPTDGMVDFEFIATAPSGLAMWDMSPITGHGLVEMDDWIKGIRIHTSNGDLEIMLFDSRYEEKIPINSPEGSIPWPWNV